MDRDDRTAVITLFTEQDLGPGAQVRLGEDAAQHARVRRIAPDSPVRVLNGRGVVAEGRLLDLRKHDLTVAITQVTRTAPPVPLEVIAPVADRDRMLLAAEKCAELQVTGWRPAWFGRSRSVTPRGEGERFRQKLTARMHAALEQSGNPWMPETHEEAELPEVLDRVPRGWTRIMLDSSGTSLVEHIRMGPMALAIGPEGGIEPSELEAARASGWVTASLGPTTLRLETAIIAAVSAVRVHQHSRGVMTHG